MFKKRVYLILTSLLLLFMLNSYPDIFADTTSENNKQDDEVVRTIDDINKIRGQYKLPLLLYSDSLNKTAETHNKYMNFNNSYSSIEESGKIYYRGRYPWDRTSYNNYDKSYVFEILNKDISNYTEGLNQLILNPYSRYGIFDPLYTDLGMNTYENYSTFLFGGIKRTSSYEVIYPYNGQKNIGTKFTNKYVINPYDKIKNSDANVGIPITYSFYTPTAKVEEFRDLDVTLTNTQTNEVIDVTVVTSLDDRNLTNSIMILPLEEYNYGTTYRVEINMDIFFDRFVTLTGSSSSNRRTVDYSGTFTTADSNSTAQISYITREQFVEDLIKTSNFPIKESFEIIFPDVNVNVPNYKYIYTAYINGIINGYGDGYYRPNGNISREQAYTIIIRAYEKQIGVVSLDVSDRFLAFADVSSIASYALDPIRKAKKLGILFDNKFDFNPNTYITVTEFQQILARYAKVID